MIVRITTRGKSQTLEIHPFVYADINGTENIKFSVRITNSAGEEKGCVADDVQSIQNYVSMLIEDTLEKEVEAM